MRVYLTISIFMLSVLAGNTQSLQDKQQLETEPASIIRIANINGSIEVKPTTESKVLINADRVIKADDPEEFEAVKDKIKLAHKRVGDTLLVYIDGLPNCDCKEKGMRSDIYSYKWDRDFDYEFLFDLKVEVPSQSELVVSTVNEGDIDIEGIVGNMKVSNVNGDISIDGIKSKVKLSTINGDVDLSFLENPKTYSRFYTLNGNINATFEEEINLDVIYETFNGEFYTNVEDISQSIITEVESGKDSKNGIKYKVGAKSQIRFREGGNRVEFETFNGDVIFKENSK